MIPPVEIMNVILKRLTAVEKKYTAMPVVGAICAAYVLYLAKRFPECTDARNILEKAGTSSLLSRYILDKVEDHWNEYKPMMTSFSEENLADIFFKNSDFGPDLRKHSASSVVDLVVKVLGIQPGDSVCDLGSGLGDFVQAASSAANDVKNRGHVVGYEMNTDAAALSQILALANGRDVEIVRGNIFSPKYLDNTFDKVYCCPPFGMTGGDLHGVAEGFPEKRFPDFPKISPYTQVDWVFAARAYASMKKGGKAVVILPSSAMYNSRAEDFRRYFLDKKLIEAVVELPEQLFDFARSVTPYLVVLSEGNGKVKMINASMLCEKGRYKNVLARKHVEKIVSMLHETTRSENMVVIDRKRLMKDDCNLMVRHYFASAVAIRDAIPLSELIRQMRRGVSLSSGELDMLEADHDTGIYYMTNGDIVDGIISENLTKLKKLSGAYRDSCAKNGDLIIPRVMSKGAAFKVAVVELEAGRVLLPNGNLLVITLHDEWGDPYFIKSYLETEYVQKYLQNDLVGDAAVIIQQRKLGELPVPRISHQRQHEIGTQCRVAVQKVVQARRQLRDAKMALSTIFVDNASDCFDTGKGGA